MCRSGMCRFGIKNWIFLLVCLQLFTYAQGGEDQLDPGVRFTTEPQDAVAAPGAPVVLPCAAMTRHASRLAWRHNVGAMPTRDHTLSPDDKYRKQLPNGSLVIDSMSASLAGQYQCVISVDGVGTIVSRVATVFLAEVPELVPGPRSVLGVAGGVALLTCGMRASPRVALRVASAPTPDRRVYGTARLHQAPPTLKLNVTWLKNGSPVRLESARVSLTPSGALEIEPLKPHDAAVYRCRVALLHSPSIFKDGDEIELRVSTEVGGVESPPRFIATPQPVTIMEGASVTFDCAATGNPKPQITWLNNGVAIDLSDLDSRFYLAGAGSLRVQSARALDAGAYTCRAHSRTDSADHTTQLHVQTAPRVVVEGSPSGAVVVARARGEAVLRCSVKGRPTPAALWLKDGDPLSPNNHDIAIVDGSSLRISGVLAVDAGMFQCAATSPAGAAALPVRLLVEPPLDELTNATDRSMTHDVFDSLATGESTFDTSPEDPDFLGETSSAYTSGPEYDYSDTVPFHADTDYSNFDVPFHAAKGLEDEVAGNASLVPAPGGLRAVIVKHRFVTLSWEAPEHVSEEVTGYALIYRVKGSERERVLRGAAQRHEMTVASLRPNTTYHFQALAYTQRGLSSRTPVIEVQTAAEELTHGSPRNVRAEALGPHVIRVSWGPPASPPLGPPTDRPTKYTVHYAEVESGREQFQQIEVDPTIEVISHTISGLRAATLYSVGVGGAGGVSVRTASAPPTAAPPNVTALPAGATSIIVRWEAPPLRAQGGPLTGYKLRYRALAPPASPASPARRRADSLTTPANTRRAELTDLDTATTYQIRVSAINANGTGPFSEWVTASTLAHQRDEASVPPQPPPLTTRSGRDWISVWWSEEGVGGSGVVVRGYLLGWGLGVPDEMSRNLPAHAHSHVIRGLESNSEYVISLRASNSRGLGPAVYGTVRTKPPAGEGDDDELAGEGDELGGDEEVDEGDQGDPAPLIPPVGVKAIMLSGSTAVVYWTDPTLPKGQPVADGRRYVVRWAVSGGGGGGSSEGGGGGGVGGAGKVRYFNATDLNCMLDELKPYTQYEFSVKLIKGGRESAWSMVVWNRTLESPPAGPPRELRVSPAPPPARAVELAWHPPAKTNGPITGYLVLYAVVRGGSPPGGEEWTTVSVSGDRTRARVDRLRARTTYLFKLQARNNKGMGPVCAPVAYTTAMETGEGGGLASATSAWLWASAGGACAVLALAAALALSLCCRRTHPPLSPDTSAMVSSTYQKSSASAGIKPPDLWIHHDQMELKHMDKGLHSSASKISAGSVEGGGLMSSTLTLGRAPPPAEYEPAPHPSHPSHPPPPASLDRRHYVPTYVDYRSSSLAGSDDTAVLHASPSLSPSPLHLPPSPSNLAPLMPLAARPDDYTYKPMTGMGGGGPGCVSTCERRHRLPHADQSTPLLGGMGGMGVGVGVGALSPQSSLASLAPPHHHSHLPAHPPCGGGACPLGPPAPVPGGDIYACAQRERGHYVAYEPLGHYTHRDSVSSETGGVAPPGVGGGAGSLPRGGRGGPCAAPLHSFTVSDSTSTHSTPTHSHSRGSVRETSPYKKSASSSPGHAPNRLQLGGMGSVAHCAEESEPLSPSRSTERLHREMQNLEGLMKDLSAITQHHFHC